MLLGKQMPLRVLKSKVGSELSSPEDEVMKAERLREYYFEVGPIRPPNEGQDRSLLIRATRNCPWNRCEFCPTYKGQRFEYRSVEEVKRDIEAAKVIGEELKLASWRLGLGGRVDETLLNFLIRSNPEIYGRDSESPEVAFARLQSLINVAGWLSSGARTVFLQDANSLIMRTPELVEVIKYLKQTFPSIERVTSYARAKTAAKKSLEELKELQEAGLSRLHIGLESGCDEVLQDVKKGVTAEEHIRGGRKVVEAGISLSEYVMPGLGGKRWTEKHAVETAWVLNQINPDFIRLRSLVLREDMPLYRKFESGEFIPLSEDEVIEEIRLFIEHLNCRSYLASDHIANLLPEIEGQLPQDKQSMLELIDKYKSMSLGERLSFILKRRLNSYLAIHGRIEAGLNEKIEEAFESIEREIPEAETKVNAVVSLLKRRFI